MDLPAEIRIVGFAGDAFVVCAVEEVGILELRINGSLWRAERWLNFRSLEMDPEKAGALLLWNADRSET